MPLIRRADERAEVPPDFRLDGLIGPLALWDGLPPSQTPGWCLRAGSLYNGKWFAGSESTGMGM